jgi:5-methylcytosine-specific restriction protein A
MKLQTLKPRLANLVTQRIPTIQPTERMRGRAAVNRRARWLQDHPLCAHCEAAGRVTAATVPDHVVPLWNGGADTEANLQSLCSPCHDAKTAGEAAERARGG